MDLRNQLGTNRTTDPVDLRRHPRFKLEVDVRVYPRDSPVVRGHTVDISESGISAMLREEVPLGGLVRLEFTLPLGEVEVLAMVRHRNAFRYGFQFVEASSADGIIGKCGRQHQSMSKQTISQQDRNRVTPLGIDGRLIAPDIRSVHNIVMD